MNRIIELISSLSNLNKGVKSIDLIYFDFVAASMRMFFDFGLFETLDQNSL